MSTSFEPFTPANGSGGRRSAQWQDDDRSWPATQAQDPWAAQDTGWAQPPGVYEPPPEQWAQPVYEAPPVYVPQQPYAQQQPYASQQAYAPQQPYAPPPQAYEPEPARRRSKLKPIAIGLVVALVGVFGWQAFRVETLIKSSTELTDKVSASQGKTDELEKRLTSVFDSESIAADVMPSVFRVQAGDFTGTAFAVGQADGRTNLFTNFHVVEAVFDDGDRTVTLERGSTRINATIVKVSEAKDLALLRTNQDIEPLKVAGDQVKPGQQVMVVGAPLGLEDSVTTGVISAYRTTEDGPTIQFDAPINPGNSGGPVVNSSRQVVGLATAKARDAEGIGLAIPIEVACETLGACGNS